MVNNNISLFSNLLTKLPLYFQQTNQILLIQFLVRSVDIIEHKYLLLNTCMVLDCMSTLGTVLSKCLFGKYLTSGVPTNQTVKKISIFYILLSHIYPMSFHNKLSY